MRGLAAGLRRSPQVRPAPRQARLHAANTRPLLALDTFDGPSQRDRDGRSFGIESTADVLLTKPPARTSVAFRFCVFCRKEREPTSGLEPLICSLRVITQALQGCAGDCKCRIFRGVSFPCLAACCTVLRSRWYQSGINRGTPSVGSLPPPTA